jgi:glucose/arabinose dehydrogenase
VPITALRRRVTPPLALSELLLLLAASVSACGEDGGGDIQEPGPVSAITVTAPATTIQVGQTAQLTATARDARGTVLEGHSFEWATADASVASVSPTGLVTGLAEGLVEIRATTEGLTGSLTLTIAPAPPGGPVSAGIQQIAAGLDFPLYLTSPPGDQRLFIVEKGGAIRLIKGGTLLDTPFLDLSTQVSNRREQGLLGLAFSPDYASTGRFFVHYTDLSGDTRVSLFRVSADPDRADPASESVVLTAKQPGPSHNGGQILFGPDGFLYIGLGDGGSRDGNDRGRGQSLADLLGSILRIDVSAGSSYTVPPDNPFVGTAGARPEVWSYGLRNPWRFSFDRANGDLYIGDVGESRWEEVNHSTAAEGAGRGANYGWSRMEGRQCVQGEGCDETGLTLPVLEYDHSNGCSITGGYVYRGNVIPALQGHYFYADFCQGWVRSLRMEGGAVVEEVDWPTLRPGGLVTSFGEDSAGELYLLTLDGGVFKIVP